MNWRMVDAEGKVVFRVLEDGGMESAAYFTLSDEDKAAVLPPLAVTEPAETKAAKIKESLRVLELDNLTALRALVLDINGAVKLSAPEKQQYLDQLVAADVAARQISSR